MSVSGKKKSSGGIVYSTDPSFNPEEEREDIETLPAAQQRLRIRLETKHRGGKAVTIVDGFTGRREDAELLGKQLKGLCGTGGSVKDGEILIQGDQREKVLQWLKKNGYKDSK